MSNLEGYVNKENNQNIIYQSRALHATFTDFSFFGINCLQKYLKQYTPTS